MANQPKPKLQRPSGCAECPLNATSTPGFCPDKIPANAEVLFIAEAPGKNEIIQGEPMVGQAGFVLRNWLMPQAPKIKIADEKGRVGIANVLRCLPQEVQGRPYPRGEDKREAERICRQYDSVPESVHTVVLFGEHSQRLHFGAELEREDAEDRSLGREPKGVTGRTGRVYEKDGKRFIFSPHPAFILRNPALVQQGQEALKIAANGEKYIETEIVQWESALQELV